MPKPKKTQRDEPKNANHGQAEQSRVEGPGGKGVKFPTRTHPERRNPDRLGGQKHP